MIISVAMNSAITIDSTDTVVPEPDRPHERAADQQVDDAGEHARRQTASARPIGGEPAGVREVDDAEAVQEFGERVAAERDEAPEHERVRDAGSRPLGDRPALQDHVDRKRLTRNPRWSRENVFGRGGNQADARRDLRREGADEDEEQQPEDERCHRRSTQRSQRSQRPSRWRPCVLMSSVFSASIIAGTISNRSPTMP